MILAVKKRSVDVHDFEQKRKFYVAAPAHVCYDIGCTVLCIISNM